VRGVTTQLRAWIDAKNIMFLKRRSMSEGDPRERHEGGEDNGNFDLIDKLEEWRLTQPLTEAEAAKIPDGTTERIWDKLQALLNESEIDSGEQ
jgi:hypothetical protein